MKRLFTPGIALVVFLTALVTVPQQQAHGQSAGLVSSVLAKLQRNHETLKTLRASISMSKYDARLREEDKYYGAVLYMPGAGKNVFVRLEWSQPQHEILGVANGRYTLYRPRLNVVYMGAAGSKNGQDAELLAMMNMSSTELSDRFQPFQDVREETLWGGVGATHLKLVPINPEKFKFKYAEVWVDSTGMPVQTKVVEKNNDATTVRLNNVEKNSRLSDKDFAVKYDPTAKVIKG